MSDHVFDTKEVRLRDIVRSYGRCIVAFSGGVDSALVLAVAAAELGESALGVTGASPSLPGSERARAAAFARSIGALHELLDTHELDDPNYSANPANRCYYCKSDLYGRLAGEAARRGYATVVDGLNADDLSEIRHGRRAASEHGVRSPLAEAGMTKDDVRALARRLGLAVWDKPAAACLSSRFPTGTAITRELLERVERAEAVLADNGLREYRVRHHGDVARIEVPVDAFE
ncbi:MAG: ATP-dependent sacrificial sulfur transferase LarE, partial [Candidatus Eremiobacteraeota bacterium]|nr:ATP-dependent sacrificial sulfur transferase LarE [Candidatus Eremiobacteraeota bacterium]